MNQFVDIMMAKWSIDSNLESSGAYDKTKNQSHRGDLVESFVARMQDMIELNDPQPRRVYLPNHSIITSRKEAMGSGADLAANVPDPTMDR